MRSKWADGGGLYLVVDDNLSKRWVLRVHVRGIGDIGQVRSRRCDIGLGGLSVVSIQEAREEAARLRRIARK